MCNFPAGQDTGRVGKLTWRGEFSRRVSSQERLQKNHLGEPPGRTAWELARVAGQGVGHGDGQGLGQGVGKEVDQKDQHEVADRYNSYCLLKAGKSVAHRAGRII